MKVIVSKGPQFSALGRIQPVSGMVTSVGTLFGDRQIIGMLPDKSLTLLRGGVDQADAWYYTSELTINDNIAASYGWPTGGGSELFGHSGEFPVPVSSDQYLLFVWYGQGGIQIAKNVGA